MQRQLLILTFLVFLVWPLSACSNQEPASADSQTATQQPLEQPPTAQEPESAPSVTETARVNVGTLQNVDLQSKTFTIQDETGKQVTFSFSDSTEITGASGSEGLSGQQGNQLMVHYTEQAGGNTAIRIQIIPR